jgi:hypothetical protein
VTWRGGGVSGVVLLVLLAISLGDLLERTYEARVESRRRPTSYGRRVGLVVVVEVPARVELAAGFDQVDETVGRSSREQLDNRAEGGEACQGSVHGCCD